MRSQLNNLCKQFPDLKIEFHLKYWETDFLRFFQNMTNYNISKESISLNTTVYSGKRSYSFSLKNPKIEEVEAKIIEAKKILSKLPEDPNFIDLEDDTREAKKIPKKNNINEISLEMKIDILQKLADTAEKQGFKIFGTFICNYKRLYIINSNGVNKEEISSPIYFECKAVADKNMVTVLEVFGGEDFSYFNLEKFNSALETKMIAAKNDIIDVEAGMYDVVLAPRCVGEYLSAFAGSMHASSLDNGQSFFEGKIDKQVFPESITIKDSPHEPGMINLSYNYDGHLYQPTTIIENGVFKNFLVGNYYGRKLKMKKNGAEAEALVMNTGDKTLEEMISGIKNGLYISSLHYMNFINQKETSVTGLTRDGTFLIKDGKISKVVNNLRFTVKISDVFQEIYAIENKSKTIPFSTNYGEFGIYSTKMPHVAVKNFQITSSTHTI